MALTVTLELPDELVPVLKQNAQDRGVSLETLVRDQFLALYDQDQWDWSATPTEEERRARHARALERQDLWGSEEDEVWDSWRPSNPETSSSSG
jgi:hypothetical protein